MSKVTAEKVYQEFVMTAKYWLKELDYYGKNQFKQKIDKEPFSIGQLYDLILNGSREYHFNAIQQCVKQQGGAVKGKKTFSGGLTFYFGRYMSGKMKTAELLPYPPVQPESIEKIRDAFYRFLKDMHQLAKEVDAAPADYKYQHPKFGYLTALEWYKLIYMQFKYFVRSKKRLDLVIRSFSKETQAEHISDEIV